MPKELQGLYVFLFILAMVIAACSPENIVDPDWCFTFDYTTKQYGSIFTFGNWRNGEGFVTDENGQLRFTYSHSTTVQPIRVEMVIARGVDVEGPINITGTGLIFGYDPNDILLFPGGTVNLLLEDEEPELYLAADSYAAGLSGTTMTIALGVSQEVRLKSVKISGLGANPFSTNECPKGTPTLTSSPSATHTGTPTITATHDASTCLLPGQPSPTPDGSPTPSVVEYTHDFDGATMPGLTTDDDGGVYDAGDEHGFLWRDYTYDVPGGTRVTQVTFTLEFETPVIVQNAAFYVRLFSGLSSYRQNRVTVNYVNGDTGLSTQAAAGSGVWNYVSVNPSAEVAVESITWWAAAGSTTGTDASVFVDDFYVRYLSPYAATPWPACTSTPTMTPSLTPTTTNTPTPFTLTPSPSRTPTRTPFPTFPPPPTVGPTRTPNPTVNPTMLTPAPGPTSTFGATSTALPPATIGFPVPGDGLPNSDLSGMTGLGDGVTGMVTNLWTRGSIWAGNLESATSRVFVAWTNAIPTAPPLMPTCVTAPMSSQLCPIWYAFQHTLFSGTIGSLLIPTATLVVDLFLMFYFIRFVRAILARLAEVLNI